MAVLRVADFLYQFVSTCSDVRDVCSSVADLVAKAEQVCIPYIRSALVRYRESSVKRSLSDPKEKKIVSDVASETEAQKKQRLREEAKARQAAIQLKMQQR